MALAQHGADTIESVAFNFEDIDLLNVAQYMERIHKVKFIADDILDKVESGDFEFVNKTDGFVGKGFTIKVKLEDGEYRVSPKKVRLGVEGPHTTSTYVTTPDGERIEISGKGFGSKLIKLIDDTDRSPRFRYPKK